MPDPDTLSAIPSVDMNSLLVPVMALAVSMVVIPIMLRVAPVLGLVDRPSARKVHTVPMARVGGWGIVLGALAPLALTLPLGDPLVQSYLWGALVLLAFGTWDDSREVGHYSKFVGQFLAVIPLVTYGGLRVERLPFLADLTLPPEFSIPFTVFALVGVINALNHSDGLDGLAGGEALLALLAMVLLGHLAEGPIMVAIGLAAIGSTLGFLRYNTHPAQLFMGDSGSQFLGFTVGVEVVRLTQQVNPALSAAVPALLLGLPVVDIVTVLAQRIYGGMNWFKATKNHVHHRLLDLNFGHHESVVIIYGVQALFVLSGIWLRYASDALVVAVYLGYCGALFAVLLAARRAGWQAGSPGTEGRLERAARAMQEHRYCQVVPLGALGLALPVYLVAEGLTVAAVPRDFGVMSAVLLPVLGLELLRRTAHSLTARVIVYATAVFVVYLGAIGAVGAIAPRSPVELAFFALVVVAIAVSVRCRTGQGFRTTPMDYLNLLVVLVLGMVPAQQFGEVPVTEIVIKAIILLYACELFLHAVRWRWNPLTLASGASLAVLAWRGLA
jgi:UDP-GlcNAc:undecaprenyl-phosphate GlcNAc-1-phosphate transferase